MSSTFGRMNSSQTLTSLTLYMLTGIQMENLNSQSLSSPVTLLSWLNPPQVWLLLMKSLPESTERRRETLKRQNENRRDRETKADGWQISNQLSFWDSIQRLKHANDSETFLPCLICITVTPAAVLSHHGPLGYVMKYKDTTLLLFEIGISLTLLWWDLPSWPVFQGKYQSKLLI